MSNIDKQALREAAEKATPGKWWIDSHGQAMVSFIDNDVLEVFATDNKRDAVRHEDTGNLSRWRNDNDATFIAAANPGTVLALLDELEAAEKRIAELERSETQLIDERDNAESALNDAYKAVMGQAPEWSNWFSFADAIDEIELACGLWRNQTEDVIQFRARIAELEEREVTLPPIELVGYGDWPMFDANLVTEALRTAGINIAAAGKGEAS